jgi:hypothetical protein
MKSLIKVVFLSLVVISMSAHSKDKNIKDISPIIFKIVGNDSVIVNGVQTTIKGSWGEAMKHINPSKNNYYKITNKSDYLKQASDIKEYMATVAKTSDVKVKYVN